MSSRFAKVVGINYTTILLYGSPDFFYFEGSILETWAPPLAQLPTASTVRPQETSCDATRNPQAQQGSHQL